MIVREIVTHPFLIEKFDHYNDFRDTFGWAVRRMFDEESPSLAKHVEGCVRLLIEGNRKYGLKHDYHLPTLEKEYKSMVVSVGAHRGKDGEAAWERVKGTPVS